jgi:hypothetical protein
MSLALHCLTILVLLVTGTAAVVPVAVRESARHRSPLPRSAGASTGLWLVESPQSGWLFRGSRLSTQDVERLLRRQKTPPQVHYFPSNALPISRVSRSLRWLRGLTTAPVVLELSGGGF